MHKISIIARMKRYMLLLFWIMGILLPITFVGQTFPWLRAHLGPLVRPIISPEWVHVVAHTCLFAGLVLLIVYALKLQHNTANIILLMGIVLMVGFSQELLQMQSRDGLFGKAGVFDIMVDLSGGLLGIWFWGNMIAIKKLKFIT